MVKRLALLFLLLPALAWGGVEQLSPEEFRALATELAPKVNLFREAWEKNPEAEFYGGTTRDFLYWIKGRFREAHTREEAEAVVSKLKALPLIDVREFIIGDSDVDVITKNKVGLNPQTFGVRKIDDLSPEIFTPGTEAFHNEQNQGFIPAEKIRLSKSGFRANTGMGDGVAEIYSGKLTITFADPKVFATTKYAKEGTNHPILLALRYLRVSAINYFQEQGGGYPDKSKLFNFDPAIEKMVREQIHSALTDKNFPKLLENHKFVSWLNGSIQKAFRSYTNPTAALVLMKEFGVLELPEAYSKKIEPINQYVFSQFRDPAKIEKELANFQVDKEKFFQNPQALFSDGKIYHGTRKEADFRAIALQGVLGSERGSAGAGLYSVAVENKDFSENWGGAKERLLSFPVKPDAKIVDIKTEGEGKRVWEDYVKRFGKKDDYEGFAQAFGIDILRYPYHKDAYVVKNSDALGKAEGVYRKVMPVSEFLDKFKGTTNAKEVLNGLSVNSFSEKEANLIWDATNVAAEDIVELVRGAYDSDLETIAHWTLSVKKFTKSRELFEVFFERLSRRAAGKYWSLGAYVIAEPLAQHPDLVLELSKKDPEGKVVDRSIHDKIYPHLDADLRKELVEIWGSKPNYEVQKYAFGYLTGRITDNQLDVARKLVSRGTVDSGLLEYTFPHPGWEKHPELLEEILARNGKEAERFAIKLLKEPQWHNPKILDILVSRTNRFFDLFNAPFFASHWADHPELFEKAIRRFLATRSFNGKFREPMDLHMLEGALKQEHWQKNPELLKLTGGAPVNLKNLEAGFRQGRTLLPAVEIPKRGLAASCGAFFQRFAK